MEVTYKATNAFGWPQLILSVYEIDAMGRDVIRGYGCVHLPIAAGNFTRTVPLYKPLSASVAQQFINWVTGRPAEFSNPKFPATGEGRERVDTYCEHCGRREAREVAVAREESHPGVPALVHPGMAQPIPRH